MSNIDHLRPQHPLSDQSSSSSRSPSVFTPKDDLHSGRAWARAVEDPWEPMILSLDGGGIRGYSTLLILSRLMEEISICEQRLELETCPDSSNRRHSFDDPTSLLPCHYFDFMYGTSTGGLIGTMLGRLRMTVSQGLGAYREVGESLFGHRRSFMPLATKYHHQPLECSIKDIVRRHCKEHEFDCDGNDWFPWPLNSSRSAEIVTQGVESKDQIETGESRNTSSLNSTSTSASSSTNSIAMPSLESGSSKITVAMKSNTSRLPPHPQICQSICLTATRNSRINLAYLLRTYSHNYESVPDWITLYNSGPPDPLRIWQVCRATTAAPFYFRILEADIHGELTSFKDGGIRENNPAGAAWNEFISLYGRDRNPGLLLSIGTGRPDESQDGFAVSWPGPFRNSRIVRRITEMFAVFQNLLVKYTEGESQHLTMRSIARGENSWYKRLNVSEGLQGMQLDEWKSASDSTNKVIPGGKTLKRMEDATAAYLGRELDQRYDSYAPPKVMLQQTAEKLVRHRRAREQQASHGDEVSRRRWLFYLGRHLGPEIRAWPEF